MMFIQNKRINAITLNRLFSAVLVWCCVWICTACGGGGGSTTPAVDGGTNNAAVSGYIVKGAVNGSTVKLYEVAADGSKRLIETTTTNGFGYYQFNQKPPAGAVVMVEAAGGSYVNEVSGNTESLTVPIRALSVWSDRMTISASVYSELAVRAFEDNGKSLVTAQGMKHTLSASMGKIKASNQANWTATNVTTFNQAMSATLGVGNYLNFKPIDLRRATVPESTPDDDIAMALSNGSAAGLFQELGDTPSNPATLEQVLDGFYTSFFIDDNDDRFNPAYLRATAKFIDTTGLPGTVKVDLKSKLYPGGEAPTGQATGGATAPMANDQFKMVDDLYSSDKTTLNTLFNTRGALVAYRIYGDDAYKHILSASVGEVYGDGDIGIGRWHGGAIATGNRVNNAYNDVTAPEYLPADKGYVYAVAKPVTNWPTCGARVLSLQQNTLPSQIIKGITSDSKLAIQYNADTYSIAYDIGLIGKNDKTYRISLASINMPWAAPELTKSSPVFDLENSFNPVASLSELGVSGLGIQGMVSGNGANKAVIRLSLNGSSGNDQIALAFSGNATTLDNRDCSAVAVADNTAINPAPVNGNYTYLAQPINNGISNGIYGQGSTTFNSQGSLVQAIQNIWPPNSTIVPDGGITLPPDVFYSNLVGNADVSVGLLTGTFNIGSSLFQTVPYAVNKIGGTLPITGTRRYTLKYATPVVPSTSVFSATPRQFPLGQVSAATLDVAFNQNPWGTPSSYGSTRLTINLNVDGKTIVLSNQKANLEFDDGFYSPSNGGLFQINSFGSGALNDTSGHYATFCYAKAYLASVLRGCLVLESP